MMDFTQAASLLDEHEVMATPAEMHGVLCGLLCGGVGLDAQSWQGELNGLVNDGHAFAAPVRQWLDELCQDTLQALLSQSGLTLLLPGEEEPMAERLAYLADWTQAFLAGFAVMQRELATLSDELQEMVEDLSNITQLDTDGEAAEEDESSYLVLYEHLKLAVMMAFEECGQRPSPAAPPTLH